MQLTGSVLTPTGRLLAPPAGARAAVLRGCGHALLLGLAVTLAQLLLTCALAGRPDRADAYAALYQWDSVWYARIAEHGYPDTLPEAPEDMAKVGFFPGYPLSARLVMAVTGLPAATAVLVSAQLACCGFWAYLFLFFRRWGVPRPFAAAGVLAIAVHPCAFFLVTGYSESLFLLAVLGFLYWSTAGTRTGWLLAAVHGVVMTATRIVGLPLAAVPLVLAAVASTLPAPRAGGGPGRGERGRDAHPLKRLAAAALLSALAAGGGLLFFGFCQLQYGRWDAYMYSQRAGWHVTPDYLAVFKPEVYRVAPPDFVDGLINPNYLSRICVPATVLVALVLLALECRAARGDSAGSWRQRLGLYVCAGVMFYITVAGLANSYLVSVIRYTLCVHVLLALAAVHLATCRPPRDKQVSGMLGVGLVLVAAVAATCQFMLIHLFTHGQWVA